jgi:hypothetical protein
MAEYLVPDDLFTLLRKLDTPAVCNTIEVVHGQETVVLNEAIVLEPARQKGFNIGKLESAWAKFEARRT